MNVLKLKFKVFRRLWVYCSRDKLYIEYKIRNLIKWNKIKTNNN